MNKHQKRVQRLLKLKGKYINIPVRSKRHANQIRLAIKGAGISLDGGYWDTYDKFKKFWIIYTYGSAGLYGFSGLDNPLLVNL